MLIKSANFILSATGFSKCPKPHYPEYAFTGRSNVGKSSLINYLTGRKHLAKTSATPGKTQLINIFFINDNWYLTDLPGYGYARASKKNKAKWQKMTMNYILYRQNLMCLFLLIDSRHKPQKSDTEFMEWLGKNEIPFVIVFTKVDKLTPQEVNKNIANYKEHILKTWEEIPPIFTTSAKKGVGKDEILNYVGETNKLFNVS